VTDGVIVAVFVDVKVAVFGRIRSGSWYSVCVAPDQTSGMPTAIAQVAKITK